MDNLKDHCWQTCWQLEIQISVLLFITIVIVIIWLVGLSRDVVNKQLDNQKVWFLYCYPRSADIWQVSKLFSLELLKRLFFIFLFCFKSIWLGKCNKGINDILWINLWSRLFKSFIDNSYPDSLGCQIVNLVLDWEGTWTWIWIGKERTDLKQYQFLHSLKLSPFANNPTPLTLIKAKN